MSIAIADKHLPLYSDGQNFRDWLFVDDHVRALLLVATNGAPGKVMILAAGTNGRTFTSSRRSAARLIGGADNARSKTAPHGFHCRPPRARPPVRHRERELGWRAKETCDTGLERRVRWYVNNCPRWQVILDVGYKAQRLGTKISYGSLFATVERQTKVRLEAYNLLEIGGAFEPTGWIYEYYQWNL